MKYLTLIVGLSFLLPQGWVTAQDSIAIRYADEITGKRLREHLYILADDSMQGRETGMEGQKKAAAYIADFFTELRVPPSVNGSYFQEFPLKTERLDGATLVHRGQTFSFTDDFFFFPGFEAKTINATAVFAGYGVDDENYSDYEGIDVSGKVVLMLPGEPKDRSGNYRVSGSKETSEWSSDWRLKRDVAKEKGAKAVIMLNDDYDRYIGRIKYWLTTPAMKLDRERADEQGALPMFFTRQSVFDQLLKSGKLKSTDRLVSRLERGRQPRKSDLRGELAIDIERNIDRLTSENVLCYIPGTDPELRHEVVVITAHYDHIGFNDEGVFNGADDDGSGTVAVLEMARAFKLAADEGYGPRRSVLLMTVSGEEKGLLGSEWYVNDPVYPLEHTVANLNVDMIGRIDAEHQDGNYIYIIGSDRLSNELHEISEQANATYTNIELDYTYNAPDDPNRFYYRSDHYNFAKNDIPVIFYFSGVHEDYHGLGDTPDKIDYGKMETIARLIFHTAWEIANRDQRPTLNSAN